MKFPFDLFAQFVVGSLVYLIAAYLALPTSNSTFLDSRPMDSPSSAVAGHQSRSGRSYYFPYHHRGHYRHRPESPALPYRYPDYYPPSRSNNNFEFWDHSPHFLFNYGRISVSSWMKIKQIKIQEIKKCGYTPYIIKDTGKFDLDKVIQEWEIFNNWISNKDTL